MDGHGRNEKGSKYERAIAKKLSKAFNCSVQRSPLSGAWRGSADDYNTQEDNRLLGDVFFPLNHPLSLFNIELKNHASVKLRSFFINSSIIQSFINQVVTDAKRKTIFSVPILICHESRVDDYLVIPYTEGLYNNLIEAEFPVFRTTLHSFDKMTETDNKFDMIITSLNGFLAQDQHDLVNYYEDCDWNVLNKDIEIKSNKEEQLDNAISIVSKLDKVGESSAKNKTAKHK